MGKDTATSFEKHAQTIIGSVILMIISWVGYTVNTQSSKMMVLDERMQNMKAQIDVLALVAQKPRFTKEDFMAEIRPFELRLKFIEDELQKRSRFMNETETRLLQIERLDNEGKR